MAKKAKKAKKAAKKTAKKKRSRPSPTQALLSRIKARASLGFRETLIAVV